MATVALNTLISTSTSYTVPASKIFIGSLFCGNVTIAVNGVALYTPSNTGNRVAPVAFNAGDVISVVTISSQVTICGQLFDA